MSGTHPDEARATYTRILERSSLRGRDVGLSGGGRIRVIEGGGGPPLVLLHGTGGPALFYLPLLERLRTVRVIAPDRPGQGLSDPMRAPTEDYRRATVTWLDGLLGALGLDGAAFMGHSMGGLWALWYALARPERVHHLVLLGGTPGLPGTRVPLPYRITGTPGLGRLLLRISPTTEKSVLQFARLVGEAETIGDHPDLIEVLVAAGRDPLAVATDRAEAHTLVAPYALVVPRAFRRRIRVQPAELRRISAPTLLVWGDREPVGGTAVAEGIRELVPRAELAIVPAGHGPWLGQAGRIADLTTNFMQLPARADERAP